MSEIHGATGSYVMNALDAAELDEFEAHLAVCPTCSREVVEFCETAAELSLLATVAAPPPALRSSVLSAISGVRVLPPILPPLEAPAPEEPRRAVAPLPAVTGDEPAPYDELAARRARRRTRVLTAAVAAVMVVALALGGWVVSLTQAQQQQVAATSLETQLLSAPDVKITATTLANGGQVSFVSSKQQNRALFVGKDLPATGSDKTLQLWTLKGSGADLAATPDNLVAGGGDRKQWFSGPIAESDAVAVTIEPTGGSQQPTLPIQGTAAL